MSIESISPVAELQVSIEVAVVFEGRVRLTEENELSLLISRVDTSSYSTAYWSALLTSVDASRFLLPVVVQRRAVRVPYCKLLHCTGTIGTLYLSPFEKVFVYASRSAMFFDHCLIAPSTCKKGISMVGTPTWDCIR